MKLPSIAIKTAMFCAALALTGCGTTYHIAYGGAYKQAKKSGKTEIDAQRIAEAAGHKAEADEDEYERRQSEMSAQMFRNLQAMQPDTNAALAAWARQPNYQVPVPAVNPPVVVPTVPHVEVK